MRTRTPFLTFVALIIFGCLSLLASSASATTMAYADLGKLVEISDVVVRGKVVGKRSFFDKEQERVLTHTTIEVEKRYMGSAGPRVTIEQWGGTYEGKTTVIPGDASFETGEEVIVFLRQADGRDDVLFLSAMSQSKYSVQREDDTVTVSRDLSGIAVVPSDENGPGSEDGKEVHTLEGFLEKLNPLIEGKTGADTDGESPEDSPEDSPEK